MDVVAYERKYFGQITDIFVEVFNAPPWSDKWTQETATEYIGRIVRNEYFQGLCCVEGDRVVGFLLGNYEYWYTGETFHIKELCVSGKMQHAGCGTRLIARLEGDLAARGVRSD